MNKTTADMDKKNLEIKNHFTATGLVFNSQNQMLMILHKKQGVWLPPGGHIEENELPETAVIREVFEETGIRAEIIPAMPIKNLSDKQCAELNSPFTMLLEDIEGNGTHNHIDLVYICRAINENPTICEAENTDIGWFTLPEIEALKTYPNVIKTAKCAFLVAEATE
ncbi:MAG: NUDIX domain-containing protein [Firmicutes bacterium]|nr:NUDIX domain-containing protein [Bacillota bacterium]